MATRVIINDDEVLQNSKLITLEVKIYSLPGYAQQCLSVFSFQVYGCFKILPALESYLEFHMKAVDSELSLVSASMAMQPFFMKNYYIAFLV